MDNKEYEETQAETIDRIKVTVGDNEYPEIPIENLGLKKGELEKIIGSGSKGMRLEPFFTEEVDKVPSKEDLKKHLKKKADQGIINMVSGILNNPDVKKPLKKEIKSEGFRTAINFALLFVGVMNIYNYFKASVAGMPNMDLVSGLILMLLGVIMYKKG